LGLKNLDGSFFRRAAGNLAGFAGLIASKRESLG